MLPTAGHRVNLYLSIYVIYADNEDADVTANADVLVVDLDAVLADCAV